MSRRPLQRTPLPPPVKQKRSRSDTNDSEHDNLTVGTTFPIDIGDQLNDTNLTVATTLPIDIGDQLNDTNFLSPTSSICSTDHSYSVTTTQEDQLEKRVDRGELIKSLVISDISDISDNVNKLTIQIRRKQKC